jgi:hypothetical protein
MQAELSHFFTEELLILGISLYGQIPKFWVKMASGELSNFDAF